MASLLAVGVVSGECSMLMDICYGLNVCVTAPPNSYIKILMPSVIVYSTQSIVGYSSPKGQRQYSIAQPGFDRMPNIKKLIVLCPNERIGDQKLIVPGPLLLFSC